MPDWYTKPNPYPGYKKRDVTRDEAMRKPMAASFQIANSARETAA